MNASRELDILKAMAAELESYLLAEALFWTLRPGSDFPQLSLGLMLLVRSRLRALAPRLTPAQSTEHNRADTQVEAALTRWMVAAETKARQELRTRLNLWQAFLAEYPESPRTSAENYAQETTHRAIAALLLRHFPCLAESPEAGRIAGLDAQLRSHFKPGRFVWLTELQSEFPPGEFWFLYGNV